MYMTSELIAEDLIVKVVEGRIDASVAIQFKDNMRELTQGHSGRVLLDLSSVDFIDSSGLGAIVAALKQLEPGQKMILCGLKPTVAKVFRLTRMDSVFAIFDDVETARAETAAIG